MDAGAGVGVGDGMGGGNLSTYLSILGGTCTVLYLKVR